MCQRSATWIACAAPAARPRRRRRPGPGRSPRCPDERAATRRGFLPPGRAAGQPGGECPCRSAPCRRHAPYGTRNRPPPGPSPAWPGGRAARRSAAACCSGRPPRLARRPALPPRGPPAPARPRPASLCNGGLRRAYREVRPSTCSANVVAGQPGPPAEEPADPQPDHHPPTADRRIGQPPLIPAMHPLGSAAAPRARRISRPRACPDAQPRPGQLGLLHHDPRQVWQQNLKIVPVLA